MFGCGAPAKVIEEAQKKRDEDLQVLAKERQSQAGCQLMMMGILICVVGISCSLMSLAQAALSGAASAVILTGPVIVGVIFIVRGLMALGATQKKGGRDDT